MTELIILVAILLAAVGYAIFFVARRARCSHPLWIKQPIATGSEMRCLRCGYRPADGELVCLPLRSKPETADKKA